MNKLYVILDQSFAERLRLIGPNPVWIVMSPENEPVVRSIWKTNPQPDHLNGITGMSFRKEVAPEAYFLDELDTIDLHHGPYSSKIPYTVLEVIGAHPSTSIRRALSELGFSEITENPNGFTATRSLDEAKKLRK